jgi:Phage integrase family
MRPKSGLRDGGSDERESERCSDQPDDEGGLRNDRDTLTGLFTRDMTFHLRGALPRSGDYQGVDGFRQLLRAKPPTFGPPKSQASYRTVPLAEPVVLEMSEHLRRTPSDDLVFAERGSPIDHNRAGHLWRTTCARAGVVGVRFHDLRHFYASTLLSAGVSIKAVQSHLGHGSAALTLDVYGHLMPSDDDRSRSAIVAVFSGTEDSLRTGAGA